MAFLASISVALLSLLLAPNYASAHILEENNGVSAILHIPPDDNPIAAQKTTLSFEIKQTGGGLSVKNCDCTVSIKHDGKLIVTSAVTASSSNDGAGEATVTFPEVGAYDISLIGHAKDASFQDFTLHYVERVATTAASSRNSMPRDYTTLIIVGSTGFILLIMTSYAFYRRHKS